MLPAQVVTVYAVQHAMLVGLTLPWHAIAFSAMPWTAVDTAAAVSGMIGIAFAATADQQLHRFCTKRDQQAQPAVLCTGLWAMSRHPAHFGEQLWWWSAALFAVAVGQSWVAIGTLFNSACMVPIMCMIDGRMLRNPARTSAMQQYMADVPFCIPLLSMKLLRKA